MREQTLSTDRLTVTRDGGVTRMGFTHDRIDGTAVRQMYETTAVLIDEANLKLLIDLTGVTLVSSGAIGMLVTIRKKLMSVGGQLHIALPDQSVRQTFHVMNLHIVLRLFDDLQDAERQFKA